LAPAFPRNADTHIVAEHHTDTMMTPESTMPGAAPRRVNLIERKRDQSESEAVTFASARQRAVPARSSLPPLTRHPPSRWPARPRTPHIA